MEQSESRTKPNDPPRNPATTWRRRQVEWKQPEWAELIRALPSVSARAITNRSGMQHPFECDIVLAWPQRGMFSTKGRREWNGVSIGSGRVTNRLIQPAEAAEALRRTLDANHFPAPEWWETGISQLGEWWTLRGCWKWPNGQPDSNNQEVTRVVWIEHDVRWSSIAIGGGLRRADGAVITATYEGAALTGPLITGMRPNRALSHAVWLRIDRDARTLADWRGQQILANLLNTWTRDYIDYSWGPETGPRLLLRNGVSARRSNESHIETESMRTVTDDLNQVAWQLGLSALCVTDVIERADLTTRIMETVGKLNEYQNGLSPSETDRSRPNGAPDQIH